MKTPPANVRWYRLPLAWFGVIIFGASLLVCVGTILLAARYPDDPLPAERDHLFTMPATRVSEEKP